MNDFQTDLDGTITGTTTWGQVRPVSNVNEEMTSLSPDC